MFEKIFRKKEKPLREYSIFDIGSKAIYTKYFNYIPTKITYYKDRVEFCIDAFESPTGELTTDMTCITATAEQTGEQLLRLEINGNELFWDTKDLAFRRKVMPEGEPIELASAVHVYPNEVLTIERNFAEKYLSSEALAYSLLQDNERYIWYYPDGSCTPAIFEIPKIFSPYNLVGMHPLSAHFVEIINHLATFAPGYLEEIGLTVKSYPSQYMENLNRELPVE